MKTRFIWWLLAMACDWPGLANAQLQLLAAKEPQRVFAGAAKNISVTFSNQGDENLEADLQVRVLQTSSATAVQLGVWAWKKLQLLPRQTVMESARLDFPAVTAETKFLVEWLSTSNCVIGISDVRVYPTNLLAELKPMTDDEGPGIFDPENQLKPILKNLKVDFMNFEETALEDFRGKLAIIGPFQSKAQMREGLAQTIQQIAKKGVAVVWLQPPPGPRDEIKPSFYVVPEGKGAAVIVQPDLVADFSENPKSQLNLIYFCKLALKPAPLSLPNLPPQP